MIKRTNFYCPLLLTLLFCIGSKGQESTNHRVLNYIFFLISLLVFSNCKTTNKPSTENFLFKELEQTDYFKYCNEEEYRIMKSRNLNQALKSNSMFESYHDNTLHPLTKRNYIIDGEYLSDWGGIENLINNVLSPFYETTGFRLELTEHIIKFDTIDYIRHEIVSVNGRKYEIFKDDFVRWGEGWYIAPIRIAEMINAELAIQNFEEKFYLINSQNDLSGSFLNERQYAFFKKHIKDPYWQPQTIKTWKKLYNLKI